MARRSRQRDAEFRGHNGVGVRIRVPPRTNADSKSGNSKPNALAAPIDSNAINAVVPVSAAEEGQAVWPDVQARPSARTQCREARALVGNLGQVVHLVARPLSSSIVRTNLLGQHRIVSRDADVMVRCERKPHQIIGEARSDAVPTVRVPPMLDVTLNELPRCGAQNLRPRESGFGVDERHDVLKLIPKTVRPAAWESAERPQTARKRLIGSQRLTISRTMARAWTPLSSETWRQASVTCERI